MIFKNDEEQQQRPSLQNLLAGSPICQMTLLNAVSKLVQLARAKPHKTNKMFYWLRVCVYLVDSIKLRLVLGFPLFLNPGLNLFVREQSDPNPICSRVPPAFCLQASQHWMKWPAGAAAAASSTYYLCVWVCTCSPGADMKRAKLTPPPLLLGKYMKSHWLVQKVWHRPEQRN